MALLKRIVFLFLYTILGAPLLFAQQSDTTTYHIHWQSSKTVVVSGVQKEILSFRGAIHIPKYDFLPLHSFQLKGVFLQSVGLENDVWEDLSAEELKRVPASKYLDTTFLSFQNALGRGVSSAHLDLIPVRRNANGKVEKLVRFQLRITAGAPSYPVKIGGARMRTQAVSNSILASAEWYKMAFPSSGIYKIDYKYLQSMGINPNAINAKNIQIWGNGGGMMPEPCSAARPEDLTENPIYAFGLEDGKFNEGDYILFYVKGPGIWSRKGDEPFLRHTTHIYDKYAYSFFRIGNNEGKRIEKLATTDAAEVSFASYLYCYSHEIEATNFLQSGRRWYGEVFDDVPSRSFPIATTGLVSDASVYIYSSLLNKSIATTANKFTIRLNDQFVNEYNVYGTGSNYSYARIGNDIEVIDSIKSSSFANATQLNITYLFQKNGSGSGYIDHFEVSFEEKLSAKSNAMTFRQMNSPKYGVVEYRIARGNATADLRVWDITDVGNISEKALESNSAEFYFSDRTQNVLREYCTFWGSTFPSPLSSSKIVNQNIRGADTPDLLIVTHPSFLQQAEMLADLRRNHDNLNVLVATTDQVYNEFSSGAQDVVAIRDCARMFYKRDPAKFKHLLLFGDASYDYKNILNASNVTSFVPIYQSDESLHPIESYPSDDYVGLLDDFEGDWGYNSHAMDIGVGRLTVQTTQEATAVVQKYINYSTNPASLGTWRKTMLFISDNGKVGGEEAFIDHTEDDIVRTCALNAPAFLPKKVYLSSYKDEYVAGAVRMPDATREIANTLNEGCFLVAYVGHGGPIQLADENALDIPTILSLKNQNALPFAVTATCDFSKYDDPKLVSAGELMLLQPNGGAIGLLTTSRPVYQNTNEMINRAFFGNLFAKENGNYLKMGEIHRRAKNGSISGTINRNFALLGDPSMTLAYPDNAINITRINNKPVGSIDTLKAQSKVLIEGNITTATGEIKKDFSGVVYITLYDKASTKLAYDYYRCPDPPDSNIICENNVRTKPYKVLDNKIFDGSATVTNGQFQLTIVVPKNIDYSVGNGLISTYAHMENGAMVDAIGADGTPLIGGISTNTVVDNTPPQIKLYMNDESFVSGGYTNEKPVFIAKLFDENGISSVGEVGRAIKAVINNDSKSEVVLNSYYKADRDTYKSGTVRYQFSNVPEGQKTIQLTAWDTDTNSATATLDFNVLRYSNMSIKNILNYPNPFTTNTVFHFDHNRPGDDLDVMVQVFTVTGKLVKTMTTHEYNAKIHFSDIRWDGRDEFGDELGRGVYVYKVSVRALSDGAKLDEFQKLVILN
jgi:hypothetical protein